MFGLPDVPDEENIVEVEFYPIGTGEWAAREAGDFDERWGNGDHPAEATEDYYEMVRSDEAGGQPPRTGNKKRYTDLHFQRHDGEWVVFEVNGSGATGSGETKAGAAIDYCETVRGGQ